MKYRILKPTYLTLMTHNSSYDVMLLPEDNEKCYIEVIKGCIYVVVKETGEREEATQYAWIVTKEYVEQGIVEAYEEN